MRRGCCFGRFCGRSCRRELFAEVIPADLCGRTLGADGAVWAEKDGASGVCPPQQVPVADTTGAGDAFFAGVAAGLTYGKPLPEACSIGTRLASSVICSLENTCPRFLPSEFGLKI